MSAQILETVIYKPKPGISPAAALAQVVAVMDPFLHGLPGFVRVWRSRMDDGTIVDNVLWADEAAFQGAEAASRENAALGPVFALFEESSLVMLRARVFEPEAPSEVLDMVLFKPKEGADAEAALQRLAEVLRPFMAARPGLKGSWRGRTMDGAYLANVLWQDEASFRGFEAAAAADPQVSGAFAQFDQASLITRHARVFS
jgi:heme-degrading monooxygenase HmoA